MQRAGLLQIFASNVIFRKAEKKTLQELCRYTQYYHFRTILVHN